MRMAKIKKIGNNKCWEGYVQLEYLLLLLAAVRAEVETQFFLMPRPGRIFFLDGKYVQNMHWVCKNIIIY